MAANRPEASSAPGNRPRRELEHRGWEPGLGRSRLAEVADTFFGVWVAMDEDTRRRVGLSKGRVKKRLDYKEVQSIEGIRDVRTSAEGLAFRLRFRDTVHIHTASGETIRGWVEDFDGNLLRVDGNTMSLSRGDVRRIELEVSDPLGNGALIGAVIGAGLAGLPVPEQAATPAWSFSRRCSTPEWGPASESSWTLLSTIASWSTPRPLPERRERS